MGNIEFILAISFVLVVSLMAVYFYKLPTIKIYNNAEPDFNLCKFEKRNLVREDRENENQI